MLWIKDIVEGTQAPPFLTNSRVDMFGFVYPRKVVARRNIINFKDCFQFVFLSYLNWLVFRGGYMVKVVHSNVGFHP